MDIKHWLLLTVLVDEHTDRDAAQVEAVQKVLDILVGYRVLGESLFVFYDTLGHSRHDIVVPVSDCDQGVNKPAEEGYLVSFNAYKYNILLLYAEY